MHRQVLANTIAVCDTEPIAIEGLRQWMEANDGPRVVRPDTWIQNGMASVRQLNPALMIVDRGFGAAIVMDWLRMIRAEDSPTKPIVWGTTISESEAIRFVQAGAFGV